MKNYNILKSLLLSTIILISLGFSSLVNAQGCAEPSSDGVNIIGFVQTQWDTKFLDEPTSSFYFNRARLGVTGVIPYDFKYYAVVEASPFLKKEHPYLLDAFVTYERFSWARLAMGSFKQPFGMELSTACSGLSTVYRSKVVQELATPDRDIGLMLMGGSDTTFIEYSLALLNGTGLGTVDENTEKDVVGRVIFNPFDFLSLGGSFKYGEYKPLAEDATTNDKRTRFGGEMEFRMRNLKVQGEYVYGKDDGSTLVGGGCSSEPEIILGSTKRSGGFLMAQYLINYKIEPVIKYEFYDSDMDKDENSEYVTTFGINYFFNDWTRLQINYLYAAERPIEKKNDQLVVQVQVKF